MLTPLKVYLEQPGGVTASLVICFIFLQEEKAEEPIVVTLLGIVIEVREEQLTKAQSPIVVTLLGMVTEVREEQPEKAHFPIVVTPSPIITCLTLLYGDHGRVIPPPILHFSCSSNG